MEVMEKHGTISKKDMDLISIVDESDEVVNIVDQSLNRQIDAIQEMGLEESNYGMMLKETQDIRGLESDIMAAQ
jgi:predicted Rossmann-fold nucleotide-binding protein